MKQKFSRTERLLTRADYRALYHKGKRYTGRRLVMFYRTDGEKGRRLGVTISKKWGNAPKRNRFKRVVRSAFRLTYSEMPSALEINIHPRSHYEKLKMSDVKWELQRLLKKVGDCAQQRTKASR